MKKEYTSPAAEKMEFNYAEAVVASGNVCYAVGSGACIFQGETSPYENCENVETDIFG